MVEKDTPTTSFTFEWTPDNNDIDESIFGMNSKESEISLSSLFDKVDGNEFDLDGVFEKLKQDAKFMYSYEDDDLKPYDTMKKEDDSDLYQLVEDQKEERHNETLSQALLDEYLYTKETEEEMTADDEITEYSDDDYTPYTDESTPYTMDESRFEDLEEAFMSQMSKKDHRKHGSTRKEMNKELYGMAKSDTHVSLHALKKANKKIMNYQANGIQHKKPFDIASHMKKIEDKKKTKNTPFVDKNTGKLHSYVMKRCGISMSNLKKRLNENYLRLIGSTKIQISALLKAFINHLKSKSYKFSMVFHGTRSVNHSKIETNGFLVPDGINHLVANGNVYGSTHKNYIYSAENPVVAKNYSDCDEFYCCAVLYNNSEHRGWCITCPSARRIIPLFRIKIRQLN